MKWSAIAHSAPPIIKIVILIINNEYICECGK
jgi:hypothetical protein